MQQIMYIHYILVRLLACIAGFCVAFLIVGIGAEAIMRTTGLGLIKGIIDLSEYSLYLIAILAAPWLVSVHGHIRVDIFINVLRGPLRQQADRFINFLMLMVSLIILYYSTFVFIESWQRGEMIYKELVYPDWLVQWQIPLAMFLISIELLQRVIMPNWKPNHKKLKVEKTKATELTQLKPTEGVQ